MLVGDEEKHSAMGWNVDFGENSTTSAAWGVADRDQFRGRSFKEVHNTTWSSSSPQSPLPSRTAASASVSFGSSRTVAPPSARVKCSKFFKRLVRFNQMDFEFAFWQQLYLFVSPQRVYRNFIFRKRCKNQWSRDDPAFVVLLSCWLLISAIGFSIALDLGLIGFVRLLLWLVLVDCLLFGALVASIMWLLFNRVLLKDKLNYAENVSLGRRFRDHMSTSAPSVGRQSQLSQPSKPSQPSQRQRSNERTSQQANLSQADTDGDCCIDSLPIDVDNRLLAAGSRSTAVVEWAYCFDVHLNALCPLLVVLHFAQLLLLNILIMKPLFVATLVGNTFWLLATGYYLYITFLGYEALSLVPRSRLRWLLVPFSILLLLYIFSLVFNCNLTQLLCSFYQLRAL